MNETAPDFTGWVTLYTDAAFSLDHQLAGIAWYARYSGGKIVESLTVKAASAFDAERLAVMVGVDDVLARLRGVKGFFIRSDCTGVVDAFLYPHRKSKKETMRGFRCWIADRRSHGIKFHVKHEPRHTKQENKVRRYLNRLCDRKAYDAMQRGIALVSDGK